MRFEHAAVSLLGGREENQDRVAARVEDGAAFIAVIDGMGGHADGAGAAETARRVLEAEFESASRPLLDPPGFMHLALGRAHREIAGLGFALPNEHRPRATAAVCLVQEGIAWWGHLGDSRLYLFRDGAVVRRTRDHSHVELLLQEGLISEAQAQVHPMRNFVESCLGGSLVLPEMEIGRLLRVQPGDVLLACSDGLWGCMPERELGAALCSREPLEDVLQALSQVAVERAGPASDNTSAAALRVL